MCMCIATKIIRQPHVPLLVIVLLGRIPCENLEDVTIVYERITSVETADPQVNVDFAKEDTIPQYVITVILQLSQLAIHLELQ